MDITLRPVTDDEIRAFMYVDQVAFGSTAPSDTFIDTVRLTFEGERSLGAFDGSDLAGIAGAFSFGMTLPGLTVVPVAGVSWVGVLPTHRRRGLLRLMMTHQLADIRERGEALAILNASEGSIYGRFGYGVATQQTSLEIERQHGAFARPFTLIGGYHLLDIKAAAATLPAIYDRARRLQPGQLTRHEAWWTGHLRDPEEWRDGASTRFYVVYERAPGDDAGYASYRIKSNWENGFARHAVHLREVIAVDDAAYTALWSYLLNIDLVGVVHYSNASADEPLRWLLADSRRLRTTNLRDFLWVRLLDLPAALSARRYNGEGRLVIAVTDPFIPENSGRYLLDGGPEGATCRATTAEPDLSLEVADLGSTYLGGIRFSSLARAGRVEEHRAGALARADTLFTTSPVPWCVTPF